MTTALAIHGGEFNRDQIDLIKRTFCSGATDDELSLFIQAAQRLRLDPFARQVFAVKRWDARARREVMSVQVSIDGFRLVAERTAKYAGQLGPFWSSDGKEWLVVEVIESPPDDGREDREAIRASLESAPPKDATGAARPSTVPATASTGSTAPAASPPTSETDGSPATTPKAPRANTIKHDGTFASHKQVAYLHMLRPKVGGLVFCRDNDSCYDAKDVQAVKVLCMYHKQLAAFKDCDGKPIKTSTNLSEAQISNLIDRYEAKMAQQAARAAEAPDLGALDREPGSDG